MSEVHTSAAAPRAALLDEPDGAALARHIITYDPKLPQTRRFASAGEAPPAPLKPIPWPAALAPSAIAPPVAGDDTPLPKADVLVVTWTAAEARALADVLTPGAPIATWRRYRDGYESEYLPLLAPHAPARESQCLAVYWQCSIGPRRVLCVKSDLHLSQDGPALPVRKLWKQMIEQCAPSLVITTGTAGAVGGTVALGDVIVTRTVRFDCRKVFADAPFAHAAYADAGGGVAESADFALAVSDLIPVNATRLPASTRPPTIVFDAAASTPARVLTTDFFAFDDGSDHYGLRADDANARAVEMGDAVLGLVCAEDLAAPPPWMIVRNASDPQIDGIASLPAQASRAAEIYERYGYWTTVGSAIACWAAIAGM